MPREKHKTRHVFAFVDPYSAENALFCPKRPLPAPFLRERGGGIFILFRQNLRGFAASTRVLPHEPQHFRRCFVSWLTSHPNFRTLYMPLRPFAQRCFLQDAINPFQKYKNSSFSLCNHLKYCIFVNNVHLSAMSPTKE